MATHTYTQTYTVSDIEIVMRRFKSDLLMIAQSSQALSESRAQAYAYDIELFAKEGILSFVDVTLLDGVTEVEAARYTVNTSGNLSTNRPGDVMWPRVSRPRLRVVVRYTKGYNAAARQRLSDKLKLDWVPTNEDIGHTGLTRSGVREYASNGWAMHRQDYRVP